MSSEIGDPPPARVAAGLVVLRRVRASDARAIAAAVGVSLGQLRRWMPWTTPEAAGRAGQLAWVAAANQMWESGTGYLYAVLTTAHGTLVGEVSLHRWVGDVAELGYWIAATQSGRGFATSAVQVMTSVALALPGVNRVEICCDEANAASAAIARKLGYQLERFEHLMSQAPGESGRVMVWVRRRAPAGAGPQ